MHFAALHYTQLMLKSVLSMTSDTNDSQRFRMALEMEVLVNPKASQVSLEANKTRKQFGIIKPEKYSISE